MKLVAALYVLQAVIAGGAIVTDRRIRQGGGVSAEHRLKAELDAIAGNAAELPVVLAGWTGFCFAAVIGILFCLAEFRRGGNRPAGIRGIIAGLGVAAFAIFWPLFL